MQQADLFTKVEAPWKIGHPDKYKAVNVAYYYLGEDETIQIRYCMAFWNGEFWVQDGAPTRGNIKLHYKVIAYMEIPAIKISQL